MKYLKRFASFLILFSVLVPTLAPQKMAGAQSGNQPNTPIEHFVVVMQQNHTFDNYFGTYPGANGLPKDVCVPVSLADPSQSCVAPFKITNEPISDLPHSDQI